MYQGCGPGPETVPCLRNAVTVTVTIDWSLPQKKRQRSHTPSGQRQAVFEDLREPGSELTATAERQLEAMAAAQHLNHSELRFGLCRKTLSAGSVSGALQELLSGSDGLQRLCCR